LCPSAAPLLATPYRVVDVTDPAERGGRRPLVGGAERPAAAKGMVVKPLDFLPAAACSRRFSARREYLRIIYWPGIRGA